MYVNRPLRASAVGLAAVLMVLALAGVGSAAVATSPDIPGPAGPPVPLDISVQLAYAQCVSGGPTAADNAIANQVRPQMNGPRLGRAVNGYNVSCARVITNTTRSRGLPQRAAVIAVTTAITESTLHNYTVAADHDSLGLFQQRPSQGWGTPAQLTDPVYATNAFLNAMLRKFPNNSWMSGAIGPICQAVQVSAIPDAYQREVHDAQLLVNALWAANPPIGGVPADFDGDGRTDKAVFRPSSGNWFVLQSSNNASANQAWGTNGDIPVPGDYDGDHRTDKAVYRAGSSNWFILLSSNNASANQAWGTKGDIPAPGDYDGDGKTDKAVFRPSNGTWYVWQSTTNGQSTQAWGTAGDIPAPGDYDGDRKADKALFRPSNGTWYIRLSSTGSQSTQVWGAKGDIPVPGDYDGDRKTDKAVYRPSTAGWYIWQSTNNSQNTRAWGTTGDTPVPGDYDGDRKTDRAVFRSASANWFVLRSSNNASANQAWGTTGDYPVNQPIKAS